MRGICAGVVFGLLIAAQVVTAAYTLDLDSDGEFSPSFLCRDTWSKITDKKTS